MAAFTGVMTADFTGFLTEVDKSVVKLNQLDRTVDATSAEMQEFSHGINQVDASLSAVGINVGKPLKALQELSALAGKNVGDMGLIGLAGSMTTTAVASYELTRSVIDLSKSFGFDLDKAVGRIIGEDSWLGRSRGRDGGGEGDEPQPRVRDRRALDHQCRRSVADRHAT